ncbi:MAG: RNA polymerase sigma factor [Planctomycetota bacterium]|jgi:RNA polymerase sigma factor (sigma-70 family)
MNNISQAEQYLLGQIRRGDNQAWSQLISRYEGRLLHFAQAKLPQRADCEDIVQDTFVSFLRNLNNYRHNCSFETYLFIIIRRKIVDAYRRKQSKDIGLIQDIYRTTRYGDPCNAFENFPAPDHTGSWYVRQDEQYLLQQSALAEALTVLVKSYKKSLNFRDLEIVELIFYCHLSNSAIARIMDLGTNTIALVKNRCLKKVREYIAKLNMSMEHLPDNFENLLNEVWELQRLSCPKRSTIGAYLLKTLDKDWHCYVDFHLNKLGCHFCRANLEDLQSRIAENSTTSLHARIMESTVGFLRKP